MYEMSHILLDVPISAIVHVCLLSVRKGKLGIITEMQKKMSILNCEHVEEDFSLVCSRQ